MPRPIRQSRFNSSHEVGEDVNPNAYIVNLADCMLVLACGFMVAMISFWNIDVGAPTVDELDSAQMQEVDPETMPTNVTSAGSGYVEAGTVYQDPATGVMYLYKEGAGGTGAEATEGAAPADGDDDAWGDQDGAEPAAQGGEG